MKSKLFILLSFFMINWSLIAQIDYKTAVFQNQENFFEVVKTQRNYFKNLFLQGKVTHKTEKAYKQFERWVYLWQDRINPDGSLPQADQLLPKKSFVKQLFQTPSQSVAQKQSLDTWTMVGPSQNVNENGYQAYPGMGRVNVIAVDPTKEQIMFLGAAAGGVWKTTDGGQTWEPKGDQFSGMGITDIQIDPTNAQTIYVATGDADGYSITSIGILKSTDGGNTWQPTGLVYSLADNKFVYKLSFAANNPQKIFALVSDQIKFSTDGGTNWQNANVDYSPYAPYSAHFQSIVFDPDDANKVIVSDYWGGLYVSTDGGSNFALHQTITGGNSRNKLKLAVSPNDLDYFYGLDDVGNFFKFRFDMGGTDNDRVSTTVISGFNSQGSYNMTLAISPTDKNKIIAAGVRGYVSSDNGQSFNVKLNPYNDPPGIGFYVHPDHHYVAFLSDGETIIDAHDGGVHKGGFSSDNWTDLSNGLVITQSYDIAITQALNGDDFMMANQDNDGFSKVTKDGLRQWVAVAAGDGTTAGIDYANPDIRYIGGTYGALYRSMDGFSSSAFGTTIQNPSYDASFISPMVINPTQPAIIYAAKNDLYKSVDNGDNWVALNCPQKPVRHLSAAPYNSSTLLCAINSSGIGAYSKDDGTTWQTLTTPQNEPLNSLIAAPDTQTFYATVPSYAGDKVIKSIDGGQNWTTMNNGLDGILAKRIVLKTDEDNETLFLGTELGVYWKNNTMTNWEKLGLGLPNVIVTDLRINYATQELYVGTYGRGLWKVSVANTQAVNFEKTEQPKVYPNPISNNDVLHVDLPETIDQSNQINYIIYNTIGGIIKQGKLYKMQNTINLQEAAKGLYFIKLYNGNKQMVQKLIVN